MEIEDQIQEMEILARNIRNEIFFEFRTSLPEKFRIEGIQVNQISSGMNDRDLNELLNNLLRKEHDLDENTSFNFEFLLNEDFIKGTLKSHILKHKLNPEQTQVIYYTFALEKPKLASTIEEEDWIISLTKSERTSMEKSSYGIGFFDGSIALYTAENKLIGKRKVGNKAIKCIRFIERASKDKVNIIVTGSADEIIRVSRITQKKESINVDHLVLCEGHDDSVEAIDINPLDDFMLCSGGYDHILKIWKFEEKHFDSYSNSASGETENPRKKVKLSSSQIEPRTSSTLHLDTITKAVWAKPQSIVTGSLDHTIKFYDTVELNESISINCKENVPTALSYQANLLLAGQEDGIIKLWDERVDPKQPLKIIKAHSKWIPDVKFHPNNSNLFLSVSYDNMIKLWDMRSTFPLVTLKDPKEKLFVAEWNGENDFLVGGADSKIIAYKFDMKQAKI